MLLTDNIQSGGSCSVNYLILLSLFSFILTAGSHSVFFVFLLQDHEKYEILSFSLASLKTPGVYCSRQQTPEALFRHPLLLFLGLAHDILFPIGAASEPLSTMGSMSIVNSRYWSIHRGYCRRYCVVLLFFGLILLNSRSADLFTRKQDLRLRCRKSGRY